MPNFVGMYIVHERYQHESNYEPSYSYLVEPHMRQQSTSIVQVVFDVGIALRVVQASPLRNDGWR